MTEVISVYLEDGEFAGWSNAYALGWPPPEQIIAFVVDDMIAVAEARHLERAQAQYGTVVVYDKLTQSQLPALPANAHVIRGARYAVASE